MTTKVYTADQLISMIGQRVTKTSTKPFKDGEQVNVVRGIVKHKHLPNELAFIFYDHAEQVECRRCKLVPE